MGGELQLSSTYVLGGDLVVRRLGYGAMRIVGQPRNFGQPADRRGSIAALRAAVDHGVTLIDTAESCGPGVSEELIAEASEEIDVSVLPSLVDVDQVMRHVSSLTTPGARYGAFFAMMGMAGLRPLRSGGDEGRRPGAA